MRLRLIWIVLYCIIFERCDTKLCFDPSPPMSHFITFLVELPTLWACDILFKWSLSVLYDNISDFISFKVPTKEEIYAKIDFANLSFWNFAEISFCYLQFTKNSAELIFAVTTSTKILRESNFVVALWNNFFHDSILWFWEIDTLILEKIINGLEKTYFKRHCIRRKL